MACQRTKRRGSGGRKRKGGKKSNVSGGRRNHGFTKSRIFKNKDFLMSLHSAKGKLAKQSILKNCGSKGVCTLSEVAKNVLAGNIPLTPNTKLLMCRYKRALRAMASKNISTASKKKNITGKWFATAAALASIIGPYLYEKFKKK